MTVYPTVSVLIPTCNRHELVRETVAHLRQNLRYQGEIVYYVSADEDPLPPGLFGDAKDVVSLAGPSRGFGANLNNLLHYAASPILFQQDDDLWLMEPLCIDQHVQKLMEDESAGWIRLWGCGFHRFKASLDGVYWRIDWESFELYIPSMRPHIKHRRFHDNYGPYPEGLKIGETEEGFGHLCKNKFRDLGGPSVLIPLSGLSFDSAWKHMGLDSLRVAGL